MKISKSITAGVLFTSAALVAVAVLFFAMKSGPGPSSKINLSAAEHNDSASRPNNSATDDRSTGKQVSSGPDSTNGRSPQNAASQFQSTNESIRPEDRKAANSSIAEFGTPEVGGEMAVATIEVDGKPQELRPNQIGQFPTVHAASRQSIPIRMTYPDAEPNQEVSVVVQDGGKIDDTQVARVLRLDSEKAVQFRFVTAENNGVYRVSLRKGADRKTFTVWVGPGLKLAQ